MSFLLKKISQNIIQNTGFAEDKNRSGERFINKDGSANVEIKGMHPWQRFVGYHYMLQLSSWKFALIILFYYTIINFVFACIYMAMGIEHLIGVIKGNFYENFLEAYFFSSQTLTTVGYGRVSPIGLPANILSSLESLVGIMTLAIITGLLYGRFTKPKAYLRFSKSVLITPFEQGTALMLRLCPVKVAHISDLEATVTASLTVQENGVSKNKFFLLPLQLDKIMSLALNWTLVHPIVEDSPLFGLSREDLQEMRFQLIVSVKGFDEGFSNTVVARSGYVWTDLKYGARFKPMYKYFDSDKTTVLEVEKLDDIEFIELPVMDSASTKQNQKESL